jgi:hypothetical protein
VVTVQTVDLHVLAARWNLAATLDRIETVRQGWNKYPTVAELLGLRSRFHCLLGVYDPLNCLYLCLRLFQRLNIFQYIYLPCIPLGLPAHCCRKYWTIIYLNIRAGPALISIFSHKRGDIWPSRRDGPGGQVQNTRKFPYQHNNSQ